MIDPDKLRAFVISLDRAADRRDRILPSLAGVVSSAVICAVDGRELGAEELERLCPDPYCARHMRTLTAGEVGCSASHAAALGRFLETGARFGLILEDDALVDAANVQRLEAVLDAFPDIDILKVCGDDPLTAPGRFVGTAAGVQVLDVTTFGGGTAGYVVSRAAAARLVESAVPVREPFDCYLRNVHVHRCRLRETAPRLVGLHPSSHQSTIGYRPPGRLPPAGRLPRVLLQRLHLNAARIGAMASRFPGEVLGRSTFVRLEATQEPRQRLLVKAFVISLARSPERLARIMPRLAGQMAVHVVEAVDGRALGQEDLTKLAGDLYAPRIGRRLHPNEIGCSASHLKALQAFLESGADHGLILEDDAGMSGDAARNLDAILQLVPNCDVLRIGGLEAVTSPGIVQCMVHGVTVLRTVDFSFGSAAYVVSRTGAAKLLRHGLPISCTYDDYLRQVQRHGCELFETAPHLATHDDGGSSTIGDVGPPDGRSLRNEARTAWYRTVSGGRKAWIRLRRFGPFRRSLVRLPTAPTSDPPARPAPAEAEPER